MPSNRKIACLLLLAVLSVAPNANTDAEREALAQLIHELESLETLIARAEREANPLARVKFQYEWLRKDLETVIDGIQDHLDAPPHLDAEAFPVLRGDYRR